jgi:recombinational DNA repair ATPase RecF
MNDDLSLTDLVLERVSTAELPDRVKDLVLAAFEGDQALAAILGGAEGPMRTAPGAAAAGAAPEMFLRRIRVRGFRGIGPEAVLELDPGPGLTVVSGRNGSGKSSFAEAVELVLTGENRRWSGKEHNKPLWREGWRNLETDGAVDISVELVISGDTRPTTVRMAWPVGGALDVREWTVQQQGSARRTITTPLWPRELELYRPFLSYDELGAVFTTRPSELHDQLHQLLGLGALDDTRDRLRSARLEREGRAKAVKASTQDLLSELGGVDDPRARQAESLLGRTKPDLDEIALLALHDDDTAETARHRALLTITVPRPIEVHTAAERLRDALHHQAEVNGRAVESTVADAIGALLDQALALHDQHGDRSCPVCDEGTLDPAWRDRAQRKLHEQREIAEEVRAARQAVESAATDLTGLIVPVPPELRDHEGDAALDGVVAVWAEWAALRSSGDYAAIASSAVAVHARLEVALTDIHDTASKALTRLDEVWRPVASRLSTWHERADVVQRAAPRLAELKKAETWLKSAADAIRDDRMAPIADQAQRIWQDMRQHSDVRLDTVRLTGGAVQRRVALAVTVGEKPTSAYSVMSQGELHALGLSLFLPRATTPASPFRFIVVDDPVQAMDPGKVNGLAEVLASVALTRQVVVFTHDDRFADAARRLATPPTFWEVRRRPRAAVEVVHGSDPVDRYLADARALATTKEMPPDLRGELVVNCCRGALEAAAHRKVRAVRLAIGAAHADVEDALTLARTTHAKLTLAVFDDPDRAGDLLTRLNRDQGPWAANVVQTCKAGAHVGYTGDLQKLITDTKRLTQRLVP